jgi:hypothetical protein
MRQPGDALGGSTTERLHSVHNGSDQSRVHVIVDAVSPYFTPSP